MSTVYVKIMMKCTSSLMQGIPVAGAQNLFYFICLICHRDFANQGSSMKSDKRVA